MAQFDEIKSSITRLEWRIDGVERTFVFLPQYRTGQGIALEEDVKDRFQSLWVGGALSPLAWLSLSSFAAKAQSIELYCYEQIDLPRGVAWMPADDIIRKDQIYQIAGSYPPFSDIFRWTLLREKGGWWVDTDVFFLGGQFQSSKVMLAQESQDHICNAIMRFPKNHACLKYILSEARLYPLAQYRWADLGPNILTRATALFGLYDQLVAPNLFYPIHPAEVHKFILPEFCDYISKKIDGAHFVHFWNSEFARWLNFDLKKWRPLPGSFLDVSYEAHGIYDIFNLAAPDENAIRQACGKFLDQKWVQQQAAINNEEI
jgi:hypothetical protein